MSWSQIELVWVKWLNQRWQNSRWLPSSSKSEWISLSQIELVWVRVRVEWECFWVNLREDNKMSESKMAVSESNMADFKMAAIIKLSQNEWVKFFLCKMVESKMAEFKMAAIIKLSQNEVKWSFFVQNGWIQDEWVRKFKMAESIIRVEWDLKLTEMKVFFVQMAVSESKMAEFKMAAIIKLSQNEMSEVFCVKVLCKMAESKMAAIIKLSENQWVWVRLN